MSRPSLKIAFVVATKDRPAELGRLLSSLAGQERKPDEIVIVDGGDQSAAGVLDRPGLSGLPLQYLRCRPPSAARQRNRGIARVSPGIDLIGFLDDDAVLAPGAMSRMMDFWESAAGDIGGAQFNLINHPPVFAAGLKRLPFVSGLGLYSGHPGDVLPSGFQVMIGAVEKTVFVRWLGSTASIWRRTVFAAQAFDEWFEGYSYLEDLDFSYRVGKRYRLAVVAAAGYKHLQASGGRGGGFRFGRREAVNRLYFVAKNPELSRLRCILALSLRLLISLAMAGRERKGYYLTRAAGTAIGGVQGLFQFSRREVRP